MTCCCCFNFENKPSNLILKLSFVSFLRERNLERWQSSSCSGELQDSNLPPNLLPDSRLFLYRIKAPSPPRFVSAGPGPEWFPLQKFPGEINKDWLKFKLAWYLGIEYSNLSVLLHKWHWGAFGRILETSSLNIFLLQSGSGHHSKAFTVLQFFTSLKQKKNYDYSKIPKLQLRGFHFWLFRKKTAFIE